MNLPNEDIPVRVDDTHNVNVEHEDVEANTDYNPNYCVKNDLDESGIERSDEDIWYAIDENDDDGNKPTFMIMECGLVTLHLIITMK